MKILMDYHHQDAHLGRHLLFKERLGHDLFLPYGMDWYDKGILNYKSPDIAKQFLDDLFLDRDKNITQDSYDKTKAVPGTPSVTYEEFMDTHFDLFMYSQDPFLLSWKGKDMLTFDKVGLHLAYLNRGYCSPCPEYISNFLTSCKKSYEINGHALNKLLYLEEFDVEYWRYKTINPNKTVVSLTHHLRRIENEGDRWDSLQKKMSDFSFRMYGIESDIFEIKKKIHERDLLLSINWLWHPKWHDGYGFVVHRSFAMGRPPIINWEYFQHKTLGRLLKDTENCLYLDDNLVAMESKLTKYSQPDELHRISKNARDTFLEHYNWEKQAYNVKQWLNNLI